MSTIDTIISERLPSSPIRSLFGKIWRSLGAQYTTKRELRRTRLYLFALTDAELRDIGLTREIADREASRSLLACYLNNSR